MSTELEDALLLLIYLGCGLLTVGMMYCIIALTKLVSGKTPTNSQASDNVWTVNAAEAEAKGNIEVANIQLKVENSQRERAGLPPI